MFFKLGSGRARDGGYAGLWLGRGIPTPDIIGEVKEVEVSQLQTSLASGEV